mmetsp:Transcript_42120/g.59155  ORF Transcript_42120/g.59155 Transcript_42120/m.59155 type:complete len:132 (-) Transcript_42120:82-477(-)
MHGPRKLAEGGLDSSKVENLSCSTRGGVTSFNDTTSKEQSILSCWDYQSTQTFIPVSSICWKMRVRIRQAVWHCSQNMKEWHWSELSADSTAKECCRQRRTHSCLSADFIFCKIVLPPNKQNDPIVCYLKQ